MMIAEIPYYMTNEKWYKHNKKLFRDELTPEAPPEAVQSYIEFYEQLENSYGYPERCIVEVEHGTNKSTFKYVKQ